MVCPGPATPRASRRARLHPGWLPLLAGVGLLLLTVAAPAPEPPRLQPPEPLTPTGWRLRWTAEPGVRYRLESTPSLPGNGPWNLLTNIQASGLAVTYDDFPAPGNGSRFYRVATLDSATGDSRDLGRVRIGATAFTPGAGGTLLPTGPVTAGLATFADLTAPILDPALSRFGGSGVVSLPALGPVLTGTFVLDGASGWITGTPPARIVLGPQVTLQARDLQANALTGELRGQGEILVALASASPSGAALQATPIPTNLIARLEGSFHLNPTNQTLALVGSASYRDVTLTGTGEVQIADATFALAGQLQIEGPGGNPYTLLEASFRLRRPPDLEPVFELEGRPDLPTLPSPGIRLTGTLARDGTLRLAGSAGASLDALRFGNLELRLDRPALAGIAATLSFRGDLSLPRVGGTALAGRLLPGGALTNVGSTQPVTFGPLRVQPSAPDQPVLRLVGSSGTRHSFLVRGEFLTPEENGTRPITVTGPLVITTVGERLDVESVRLTNALPIPQWPLPQSLRLTNLNLLISLTNDVFEARLRAQLRVTRELTATNGVVQRATLLGLDSALGVNIDDPTDVTVDTALRAERIPLLAKAYLRDATFRLRTTTRPLGASLALVDASAGFFPKYQVEPASPGRDDFLLYAERVGASIAFQEERFALAFTNGILHLPTLFTNQPPGLCPDQRHASVALGTNTAITLDFDPLPTPDLTLRARGDLRFRNLTFLPGGHGFGAELCQATLAFNPGGLPYLTNLQGAVQLPLPPGQTNRVELLDGAWELDGWPSGTIALMSDLTFYEGHGLTLTLLGRRSSSCPTGTALTVLPGEGLRPRTLVLDGGIKAVLPADLVTEVEGDRVSALACTRLTLPAEPPFLPQLELRNLEFTGHFHLGGGNGLLVTNGLLSLRNLDNLFELGPTRPMILRVGGTVSAANLPSFTLQDARFTFFDPDRPPRFDLAGLGYDERQFPLFQKIPARLTRAAFTFDNREAPLSRLFHPTNLNFTVSGVLAFPTTGDPMFETSFDDAKLDVNEKGAPIFKGLDGLAMTLRGLDLPPLDDIGGRITAFGLSSLTGTSPARAALQAAPPSGLDLDLDNLFLAGRVSGSYQGYKVNLILAFRLDGMVGVCVDFNAGNVGIPLDAGYLGGVLLTGASGGMAFGTGFIEPCDFTQYLGPDGKPKPGITELPPIVLDWEQLRGKIEDARKKFETFQEYLPGNRDTRTATATATPALAGPALASFLPHARYTNDFGLPCPGDCPPTTINIFCQPHPDEERFPRRVIARFSSIDEPTLNRLGFTRDSVRARFAQGGNGLLDLPLQLARAVRNHALDLTPLPDPAALGAKAAEIQAFIDQSLGQLEANLAALLRPKISDAASTSADAVYDTLRDAAYAGAPCPDLTLSLSGTFTHTAVSSFLSGTVGATVSTAGSAGVSGKINVLGVPLGRAKAFLSATDDRGDLNPALCAEAEVSVGPFELGTLRGSYAIEDGPAAVQGIFEQLTRCLGDSLFADLVAQVAPRVTVTGRTRVQIASDLTASEKIAFIGQLYSRPSLPAELRSCFREGLATVVRDINPEILFCGEIQPKLFSFPLGQSLFEGGLQATKTEFTGVGSYSPSLLLATTLLAGSSSVGTGLIGTIGGPLAATLFSPDQATYGLSYRVPDPLEPFLAGIDGQVQSPAALAAYLDRQFDAFVENATYTFAYSLSPLGFKTVDSQMRVVLPNLTAHPARPGSTWIRPENRPGTTLPSRLDLVLSALTNRLSGSSLGLVADPKWRGTSADLALAFPAGSAQRTAVSGLSFANAYFPHGGVVGGAYVQIPRALYEAPAPEYFTAINPSESVFNRLGAAIAWIQDHVLVSRQAGALGFYLPAPNPPVFTDRTGAALTPRALLEAIRTRELDELATPGAYPASELFLRGYLDGQLLGIPIARSDLEAALADPQAGTEGLFRVRASVPAGSWLDAYSPGARFLFELRQAPGRPIQDTFQAQLVRLLELRAGTPGETVLETALRDFADQLTNGLPRLQLEAELPLQFPAALRSIASFAGGTWLHAYSPRFDPSFNPTDDRPRARARRDGGLAFRGHLDLRAAGTTVASIPNAELAVHPRPGATPSVSGSFDVADLNLPALPLRAARLDFATEPSPRFTASGTLQPLDIGPAFRLESPSGGALTGRVEVLAPNTLRTSLRSARLRFLEQITTVRGDTPDSDFGFRTDGPWSATLDTLSRLRLGAGGIIVLELESTGLINPIRIDGVGTSSATVTAEIRGGTTVNAFPGRPYARSLSTRSGTPGRLVVRSDGTFEATGTLGQAVDLTGLSGIAVTRLAADASFRLTQDELTLNGRLGGGALESAGGPSAGINGTVTLHRDGTATATATGGFAIPALQFGRFIVDSPSGGPIEATLTANGINLTGARLRFDNLLTNALPTISLDRQGNFALTVGAASTALGPFAFPSLQYQLIRTNGTISVTNLVARWSSPTLGSAVDLRGHLASDGQVHLTHTAPSLGVGGFSAGPVQLNLERAPGDLSAPIAASAPKAWWSLNETSGTTVANRADSRAPGSRVGAVAGDSKNVAGLYPGNASFQFSGGHVAAAKGFDLGDLSRGFSIVAWFRVATFDRTWNTIASKGDSSWRLQRSGDGTALGFDTDGVNPPYLAGNRPVNDGRWHHVAAVYDGRIKSLWIDGELDAWTPATGAIAANAFDLLIGENSQQPGRRWNGWIDELALYDRALAPAEILAQVRAGAGLVLSGSARVTLGGLSDELAGTFSPDGAIGLEARRSSVSLGGFATQDAVFRLLRGSGGATSFLLDASLALPGIPAARLAGTLAPSGLLDLTASLPGGQFGALTVGAPRFQLRGIPPNTTLTASGSLDIAGLTSLPLSGQIASDATFALTNSLAGAGTLFNFPTRSWEHTLRRQPSNYRAYVAGDPFVTADLGTSPIAYWRLDETSGTTANDGKKSALTRPAIHGTYTGGVTLGQPGGLAGPANARTSARFDGVDDHVLIGNESAFDFTGPFAVSAWIRVGAWTRDWQAVLTKGDTSWRLSRYSNTRRLSFDTTSAAGHHSLAGTLDVDDGAWHHVVAVYDGRAKFLYLDGALDAFAVYRQTPNRNDAAVMIGENAEARGRYFNGWIDEVTVYNRALAPTEVIAHYLAGGGTAVASRTTLALAGAQNVEVTGLLHPRGSASLTATLPSLALSGFSLVGANAALHKIPGLTAVAALSGTAGTALGSVFVAGTGDAAGNYLLESATTGSLSLGDQTFSHTAALALTRTASPPATRLAGRGTATFGGLSLTGDLHLPPAPAAPSFSGSATGTTPFTAFGKTSLGKPGHPYAGASWTVSGTYDASRQTLRATIAGTLTVEYEVLKPGGNEYPRKVIAFGPLDFGTDGRFTVSPGETFNGIGSFPFRIP